ncbi:uncharacterized protein DS421_12g384790 [Arachis hypogaea]|nr:uncharacterized protein DS421_12g384790 [Arachis hypogaea]
MLKFAFMFVFTLIRFGLFCLVSFYIGCFYSPYWSNDVFLNVHRDVKSLFLEFGQHLR